MIFVNGPADEMPSSPESTLLGRLTENGATESSSMNNSLNNIEENSESKLKNIELLHNVEKYVELLHNIELLVDGLRHDKAEVSAAVLKLLPHDGTIYCR